MMVARSSSVHSWNGRGETEAEIGEGTGFETGSIPGFSVMAEFDREIEPPGPQEDALFFLGEVFEADIVTGFHQVCAGS